MSAESIAPADPTDQEGIGLEVIGWRERRTGVAVFVLPSGEAFLERVELLGPKKDRYLVPGRIH